MTEPTQSRANRRTVIALSAIILGMGGLTAASVPLYRLFCQVTGYGGTTQRADVSPDTVSEREIIVRFDATTDPGLPWRFEPAARRMKVRVGETSMAFYRAENLSDQPITGTAVYNVVPNKAGLIFNKIACFCFEEQTLMPGESVDMPVRFFIDPAIEHDPNLADIQVITLSYTFYRSADPDPDSLASASVAAGPIRR